MGKNGHHYNHYPILLFQLRFVDTYIAALAAGLDSGALPGHHLPVRILFTAAFLFIIKTTLSPAGVRKLYFVVWFFDGEVVWGGVRLATN